VRRRGSVDDGEVNGAALFFVEKIGDADCANTSYWPFVDLLNDVEGNVAPTVDENKLARAAAVRTDVQLSGSSKVSCVRSMSQMRNEPSSNVGKLVRKNSGAFGCGGVVGLAVSASSRMGSAGGVEIAEDGAVDVRDWNQLSAVGFTALRLGVD